MGGREVSMEGKTGAEMIARATLCLSGSRPGLSVHSGDDGFAEYVQKHYSVAENNALEGLMLLKSELSGLQTDRFWTVLMEGMTALTGSQYAIVTKRILVDDQDSAIEMPPLGEPGSCMLATAIYWNDGDSNTAHVRDYKYHAYGGACAHMKHDKVFMIPGGMPEFIHERYSEFPIAIESYLGIPLFWQGKCFAHFGTFWSLSGLEKRVLSWGFIETMLHALEDVIVQRLVEGQAFGNLNGSGRAKVVIPNSAITAAQSLKPYARSLSHELRTPLQGVVGMLDIMNVTVQEALDSHPNESVRQILQSLRENIETVQGKFRETQPPF
jgi:hypothetical protein